MLARVFLAAVGVLYALLGVWCALFPTKTSQAIGFDLRPGGGQSEFLTLYGGLEIGLAMVFLWPLYRTEDTLSSLRFCMMIHFCLVVFRTIGFFVFSGIETKTYVLAGFEWLILIGTLLVWSRHA